MNDLPRIERVIMVDLFQVNTIEALYEDSTDER